MASPVALAVRNVSRRYGGRAVVSDASLELHPGRITCLLGPSGCGKSTLLRLIAGLEPVDAGTISAGDRILSGPDGMLPPESRSIGFVFQDYALFPHLDVADNIGFGLKNLDNAARRARVKELLARFHLEKLEQAWPHTLSGGEQQRVAIARALAREPAVLLLDEPFSGLDGHLRNDVRRSVLADLREAHTTVLIVTHDPEEALLMADDLILMAAGQILQTGTPDDCYLRPVSIAAARLLGEATLLPARIEAGVAFSPFGSVPAAGAADGPAQLMVRPEGIRISADLSGACATVVDVGFAGPFRAVMLVADDITATARIAGVPPPPGARVGVTIDADRTCIYPA
ncbi:MAG: ABC transporter ATP-binding protein [Sphingomonadaceae bacterium]